jgi:hypothetical protein
MGLARPNLPRFQLLLERLVDVCCRPTHLVRNIGVSDDETRSTDAGIYETCLQTQVALVHIKYIRRDKFKERGACSSREPRDSFCF